MAMPALNLIGIQDRHRLVEKTTVPASTEPYRLHVRRNGVYIRSFESEEKRDAFIESAPDSVFCVKTTAAKKRW